MNARQRRLHRRLYLLKKRIWDSEANERKLTKLIEGGFDKPSIIWPNPPVTDYCKAKALARLLNRS